MSHQMSQMSAEGRRRGGLYAKLGRAGNIDTMWRSRDVVAGVEKP